LCVWCVCARGDVDGGNCREQRRPRLVGLAVLVSGWVIALRVVTTEQDPSALESSGHVSRGEQAVVPDLHEAVRQHVLEKSTYKYE